ncbi:Hsp70 family protein [Nocardia sp. NBC_00416]|uniref:Hsp70 family protein n=1 Tax=Nocardia sp. NBC_00416 TaxID=2975991 RepID=UPI002E1F538B
MVLVLGVSVGASGARAVLTHSDQPHLPPIDRCHIHRPARASLIEPVLIAVRRMHSAARRRDEYITGTAVTCQNRQQAELVGDSLGTGRITLVDEPLAQLRYLRFTEKLPASGAVALFDLGSSGLTLTQIDCRTDTVLAGAHCPGLGGDGYDELLCEWLDGAGVFTDESAAGRYREALSSARVVTAADPSTAERAVITRSDLAELCADAVSSAATLVHRVAAQTEVAPDAVALLGGCARNPALRARLTDLLGLPLVCDSEPEYVSARGALLFAAERPAAGIRTAHIRAGGQVVSLAPPTVGRRKVYAAAAVTIGLGATVAGLLTAQNGAAQPTRSTVVPTDILDAPPEP